MNVRYFRLIYAKDTIKFELLVRNEESFSSEVSTTCILHIKKINETANKSLSLTVWCIKIRNCKKISVEFAFRFSLNDQFVQ